MKKLFSSLSLLIALLFIPQINIALAKTAPLDTTHWISYPVGRYLINLPPSANFYWHPLRFRRKFSLVWKKDLNIEEANALLRKEAEIAKQSPHDTEGTQFFDFLEEYGNFSHGSALATYPYSFTDDSLLYRSYFTGKTPNSKPDAKRRTYYYEEETFNASPYKENTIKFIDWMGNHVTYNDSTIPIHIIAGTYFEGGFLWGPNKGIPWPGMEEIGVEVTFPEYPGIEFSIFFDHMFMDTPAAGAANTTIAGQQAREGFSTSQKNGITHYNFGLESPSKKDSLDHPRILMHLQNPEGGVMRKGRSTIKPDIKRPSFKNDEEAKAVWKAIRESVRWRPDNLFVDAPKGPYYLIDGRVVPHVYGKLAE